MSIRKQLDTLDNKDESPVSKPTLSSEVSERHISEFAIPTQQCTRLAADFARLNQVHRLRLAFRRLTIIIYYDSTIH